MAYKLTLRLESQKEGGFTITCKELPELITECDSLDDMKENVLDAFTAILELYQYRNRPLPESIKGADEVLNNSNDFMIETVVSLNEISANSQKAETIRV